MRINIYLTWRWWLFFPSFPLEFNSCFSIHSVRMKTFCVAKQCVSLLLRNLLKRCTWVLLNIFLMFMNVLRRYIWNNCMERNENVCLIMIKNFWKETMKNFKWKLKVFACWFWEIFWARFSRCGIFLSAIFVK